MTPSPHPVTPATPVFFRQPAPWRQHLLPFLVFSGAGLLLMAAGRAEAISYADLNPAGAQSSGALGVSGGQQAGWAYIGGSEHAALWTGTAASFVDLNPAGADWSTVYGVSAGIQVGVASFGGVQHAGMWSGNAASFVDLNPAGATQSAALGVGGGQQVGYAVFGGTQHAALWTGRPASFVDLNPPQVEDDGVWLYASYSFASATDGAHQAGGAWGYGGGGALWSGTAASYLQVGPVITGISGDWRVGNVDTSGGYWAVLWSAATGAFEYLPPSGAWGSSARAVSGRWQVGTVYMTEDPHAALWSGTPSSNVNWFGSSYVDLGDTIGESSQTPSDAYGLSVDGNSLHIAGDAGNHAVLWTVVVPEPAHSGLVAGLGLMGSALFLRRRIGQ